MDWQKFWRDFPQQFDESDHCRQVGRTAHGGQPTPESELRIAVAQVRDGLVLEEDDRLLDLCCGNGLLTVRLSTSCALVVGIDFSAPMIELARLHHARKNVQYVPASVFDLSPDLLGEESFTKVCMFESLQYFMPEDLPLLLRRILSVTVPAPCLYFSGVLDKERIWSFFDTDERRADYERQKSSGEEIMGHWWERGEIEAAAQEVGFRCQFIAQDEALNTSHYRFDVRLTRD